jgi:hypothetical protein
VATNGTAANSNTSPDYFTAYDDHTSVAADSAGNVYYAWVAKNYKPYLSVSRHHGRTWSRPVMVAPPGVREAALAAVAVPPSGRPGQVAIAFMGSTDAPADPYPHTADRFTITTWGGYLVTSADALTARPAFRGAAVNPPGDPFIAGICGPQTCQQEKDFIDVQIAPNGRPWAAFVDACNAQLVCKPAGELVVATL